MMTALEKAKRVSEIYNDIQALEEIKKNKKGCNFVLSIKETDKITVKSLEVKNEFIDRMISVNIDEMLTFLNAELYKYLKI